MTILLGLPVLASADQGSAQNNSHIYQYMELYGYRLSEDVIKLCQAQLEPQEIDCGNVLVKFCELLYDEQWAYVAASISPKDPAAVLVLPGDAQAGDPVAGFYDETAREDERTFQMAAKFVPFGRMSMSLAKKTFKNRCNDVAIITRENVR
ncbi:MAG: hypothetical protein RSD94_08800 [Acinetobacter sp.]